MVALRGGDFSYERVTPASLFGLGRRAWLKGPFERLSDLVRAIFHDKHLGSTKITTHLDYIIRCKTTPGTNWLNK
jgi:hypothetical protein